MWDELREDVAHQLAELRELRALLESELAGRDPDPGDSIRALAAGAVLHAFYCGVESTLKRIAAHTGEDAPRGESWHLSLLQASSRDTHSRPRVVSDELLRQLAEYLRFRHAFRNVYPQHLDWARLSGLLARMPEVLARFASEMDDFLSRLERWPSDPAPGE